MLIIVDGRGKKLIKDKAFECQDTSRFGFSLIRPFVSVV
jgi:hypothetical protein